MIIGLFLLAFNSLKAQDTTDVSLTQQGIFFETMQEHEDSLAKLAVHLKNQLIFRDRLKACYEFIPAMVQSLKEPGSFYYPYDNLDFISNVYAPDSTFRILTWLVKLDNSSYRYFGTIQMNSDSLKMYPFFDEAKPIAEIESKEIIPRSWYGCVYYNITKEDCAFGDCYTLYGWDGNNIFSTKKYVDVLQFRNDSAILGAPIFNFERDSIPMTTNRLVLEYNNKASAHINYDDELEMIVYDHLVPQDGESFGMYATYIPDGTYEALKFEDTIWTYIPKVFHQTMDEPPIPTPLFEDKGDIPVNLPGN